MTPKEKAEELIVKMSIHDRDVHPHFTHYIAKQCALIAVENEYKSNRELLFNLRSVRVIKNPTVYLARIDKLIKEEQEVKQEIDKL
jgi:hypothetical protein